MARLNLAQRAIKRVASAFGLRAYEAGMIENRLRDGVTPSFSGVNTQVTLRAQRIANSARDAVRNDAFARRIVDLWAANAVGAGVTCAWQNEAHASVWRRWAETTICDAEGRKTLAGIEAAVMRAVVMDGEAVVRLLRTRLTPRNPIGLELQVLEGDYIDRNKNGMNGENRILQGVEINPRGRPVAYWLLPQHPGETWPLMPAVGPKSSTRTPADEVLHIFRQERPGQVRGVSWLAPVLPVLRDLTDYETALLVKAKIEACLAAVVNDDSDETATGSRVTDANGLPVETFEPGMILYRKGAGEIEIVNPSGGGSHLQFARRALERAAVGAGLTYDQVSGDLSSANYSSLRAGKIEFRALNQQVQWTLLLPQLCVPIAEAFDDAGYVAQLWDRQASRYTHTPPAPEMVDPMKDTMAIIAQVRAGLLTPQRASAMMGYEFAEVVEEYAAALEALDGSGIVLDTDARRVAKSGSAQDAAHIAAVEIAATGAALPRQTAEQPAQQ